MTWKLQDPIVRKGAHGVCWTTYANGSEQVTTDLCFYPPTAQVDAVVALVVAAKLKLQADVKALLEAADERP